MAIFGNHVKSGITLFESKKRRVTQFLGQGPICLDGGAMDLDNLEGSSGRNQHERENIVCEVDSTTGSKNLLPAGTVSRTCQEL